MSWTNGAPRGSAALQISGEGEETVICGLVADQSALHGLLTKVRDLGLCLISVRRLDTGQPKTRHREVPDDRGLARGTFSQAELTVDRVITRCITRSASVGARRYHPGHGE